MTLAPRGSTALHIAVVCATLKGTRYYAHPLLVTTLVYCGADVKLINIQETTADQILKDAHHMPEDRKVAIQDALNLSLPGRSASMIKFCDWPTNSVLESVWGRLVK